jgi:hypothetical protein
MEGAIIFRLEESQVKEVKWAKVGQSIKYLCTKTAWYQYSLGKTTRNTEGKH